MRFSGQGYGNRWRKVGIYWIGSIVKEEQSGFAGKLDARIFTLKCKHLLRLFRH